MGSLTFSKKIALRYLWSRRSEAFITIITIISVLGVAIGVMVLNIVMAVMTGFEFELREKIIGANSHIVVRKLGGKIAHWEEVKDQIQSVDGVDSVSAFTYHQALLRTSASTTGLIVRGIEKGGSAAAQLGRYMEADQKVDSLFAPPPVDVVDVEGNEDAVDLPGLVIGRELSRSLTLFVGDTVSLLSPNVASTPFGLVPKFRRFVIAGVYSSGLVEYESGLAYASIAEAQRFFKMGDSVSGFEVRARDVDASPIVARKIIEKLGGLATGFTAQDWTETNKPLWDAIRLEKKAYFVVLLLIIVMASFSIISTLIMIVLEKRKDIAVLKTMGATTASVANIFRIQGAVIGLLGTVLGVILGYAGCIILREYGFPLDERIFQMTQLPIRIEPLNFFVVAVSAFTICFVATIYPARRASRLQPAEVLRYE